MSIEHDQSTRKQMRVGVTGENPLRPLDEFSVTCIYGHLEIDAWITLDGTGMGRSREYSADGKLIRTSIEPTGIVMKCPSKVELGPTAT